MNEEETPTELYRCEDCGEPTPGPSGLVGDPQALCEDCIQFAVERSERYGYGSGPAPQALLCSRLAALEAEFKAAGGQYADSLRWVELMEKEMARIKALIAELKEVRYSTPKPPDLDPHGRPWATAVEIDAGVPDE